jgi:chemotaxis protein MotA
MVVIGGIVVVLAAVLLGFTMAGGKVAALIHLSEFVTIGGASLGALIVMSSRRVLRDLLRSIVQAIKGTPFNKPMYTDLFKLLYALARVVRREGLIALESHVINPNQSAIFKKYPRILQNHHAKDFLCDALAMLVDGKAEKAQITSWLEEEVKVIEREHHAAVGVLSKTADALPGFGIVAAVLGIVVTMQAIGGPVEEIGHKVGAALVGTFLGILMSYGLFAPLAGRMELLGEEEATFFRAISSAVVAISEGTSPKDVVLCVRRSVGSDCRPSQAELNQIFKEGDGA